MEEEGGEIRFEAFFNRAFPGIGTTFRFFQTTNEMLILENYNAACVSPFLFFTEAIFKFWEQ